MSITFDPIAIIGRGCLLPGATGTDELWDLIRTQSSAMRAATTEDWPLNPDEFLTTQPGHIAKDAAWNSIAGFLPKVTPFSRQGIGELAPDLDKVFHMIAHAADQALAEAGWVGSHTSRAGLIMGNLGYPTEGLADLASSTLLRGPWANAKLAEINRHPANRFSLALPLHYTARLFGLSGPCFALDVACASALYAVKLACDRLNRGEVDLMLAGGVNASDPLCLQVGFSALNALSYSGSSRPFSASGDGLVPSQGVAMVALKRLSDAVDNGDRILGVIRGVGLSNDGRAGSFLTPSSEGQSRALKRAFAQADIDPGSLGYIECHATGTQLGDATELQTLDRIYTGCDRPILGSLKACIGHTLTASGAAGLLKVLGMFEKSCLPGTPNTRPLNRAFDGASFEVLEDNVEWSQKRIAGISCFGFSGNNAHLLVEAWEPGSRRAPEPAVDRHTEQRFALVGVDVKTHRCEDFSTFRDQLKSPAEQVRTTPIVETVGLRKTELIFPPADLMCTQAQQLWLCRTAMDALQGLSFDPARTAVLVGMQTDARAARHLVRLRLSRYIAAELTPGQLQEAKDCVSPALTAASVTGAMANITANRLNHILALEAMGCAISAEELSGDTALDLAMQALGQGEISTAIVGAVDLCREEVHAAAARQMLPDKPEPGDAAVVFVLKTMERAEADGDTVLAELSKRRQGSTTPVGDASETCARQVQDRYGHAHCARGLLQLAASVALAEDEATAHITNRSFTGQEYSWRIDHAAAHHVPKLSNEAVMVFPLRRPDVDLDSIAELSRSGQLDQAAPETTGRCPDQTRDLTPSIEKTRSALGILGQMQELHRDYLDQQSKAHLEYLKLAKQALPRYGQPTDPTADSEVRERMALELRRPGPAAAALWEWPQMLTLAQGRISDVFGEEFRGQDDYPVQVRLPEPPLLLCDRVLAIDAVPMSLGLGTIWTEHRVTADRWYLHQGRIPPGIFIECGQADLVLISYLGIDAVNRGMRAYRLLGCEITWSGELPKVGDTLKHEIRIVKHAQQGEIRLILIEYDCWVDGEVRAQVRHCSAGFFTREEIDDSKGILWEPTPDKFTPDPRGVHRPCVSERRHFSREQVAAFSRGELWSCFGERFAHAKTHHRTPTIEPDRLNFIHRVTHFDPNGGLVGRGYMRAVQEVSNEGCFLDGHFLNDPCMPGTLMANGCQQMQSFFLAALGFSLNRDGWLFAPKQHHPVTYSCRGEVNPQCRELVYELFVDEIAEEDGCVTLYAHVLCTVDGKKALLAEHSAVSLVPGWPADSMMDLVGGVDDQRPVASIDGWPLDYKAIINGALGQPSRLFGPDYWRYDGAVPGPRFPNPPYLFMTRVSELTANMGRPTEGSRMEALYDIPVEAWYFGADSQVMPFAILMEIALQPCGCLAALNLDAEERPVPHLLFRNLDGKSVLHRSVTSRDKTIRTTALLTSHSKSGETIIVKFEVRCFSGEEEVFTLDTTFGFFPPGAFVDQQGMDNPAHPDTQLSDTSQDDTEELSALLDHHMHSVSERLRMLDCVTGFWPHGGEAQKGQWRGEKTVGPDDWYFKAHFYSDPVQPGSLGVEGVLQLLQLHMRHKGWHQHLDSPRFEPCLLDTVTEWNFRGQVVPADTKVVFEIDILDDGPLGSGYFTKAEGRLLVDDKLIYRIPQIGMRLTGNADRQIKPVLEEALRYPSAKLPQIEVKATTQQEHIRQYIQLANRVFKEELGQNYPTPSEEDLAKDVVVVGLNNNHVVGGLRIGPPCDRPFSTFDHALQDPRNLDLIPDWKAIRQHGTISEVTGLIGYTDMRGRVSSDFIWKFVSGLLVALKSDFVLIGASMETKTPSMFATSGFKPIAPPIIIDYGEASSVRVLPMLARLNPNAPMPPCVYDIDWSQIDEFARFPERFAAMRNSDRH